MPKLKNIIIFVAIAAVFALIYIFFLKTDKVPDASLVSSPNTSTLPAGAAPVAGAGAPSDGVSVAANDFLTLLLGVKNIKLPEAIFSDPAFQGLRDSSIVLVPDGNEGRPNPFAPLGQDIAIAPLPSAEEPEEELDQFPPDAPNPDFPENGAEGEDPAEGAAPGDGII
jgi:hypothetical protein